jgi:hypothetical protein
MTTLSREKERWIMAKRTLVGLALLGVIGGAQAWADDTCNGLININYPGAPAVSHVGDVIDVQVRFGAGSVLGGTELQLTSFAFDLDCNPLDPLTPPCTDDGAVVSYMGDTHIMTDCMNVTWKSDNPVGGTSPNVVVFTATPTLDIPANSPVKPGFCSITFEVQLVALSPEGTVIPELVGYQSALCDNTILDSGGFQTADITTARGFGCYQVPRVKIPAPQPIVKLQDRFGTTTSKPVDFHRFCAPEDKNGEDPTAPASPVHIGGFALTSTTGTISHPKGLSITTQFGTLKGDLGNPEFLFTPTSKSLAPPPPPPLPPDALRHFQCYRLANVSGAPKTTGIHLTDQFTLPFVPFGGFTADLNSKGPFRLCVPVDKKDEDPSAITDPQAMLCYTTQNDRLPFNQFTAFVTNQFGGFTVNGTQFDELCEPAAIAPFTVSGRRVRIRRR